MSIPYDKLEEAFSKGKASEIMEMGANKVLISIEGKEGVYSQSQGTQILNVFFKDHPPKSFSFDFKGKEESTSTFAIGEYHSKSVFRISVKFKKSKTAHQIESISILSKS